MTSSKDEIEKRLREGFGIRRGPFLTGQIRPNFYGAHYLFREWLESLGIPHNTVAGLSDRGVENAWCAGEVWCRKTYLGEIQQGFKPGREFRRARGVKPMDLTDEGGGGFKPGEVLDVLGPVTPTPKPETPLFGPDKPGDLNRRLDTAIALLERKVDYEIKSSVEEAVERMAIKVSQDTRAALTEIATQAAEAATIRLIEERVPKRLEIISPRGRKILDAEPRHEAFERIFFWLALKRHVYIVGPHGTGKTHLFKQLAGALDLKYFPIGQTLTKYELSGHKGPTGEYIGTLLREAIETGGFVGIDEGDTWAAAAMVFLNTPLANGYCSFPDKVVEVHPDFICAIAANTWGHGATMQYQGRNPLDAASLDRFAFEEVDYDEKLEIQLYGNSPWTQYCHRVRKVAHELRIYEAAPSMRGIEMGNLALDAHGDPDLIQKSVLWKGLASDTVAKIKAQAGTFGKTQLHEVA